VYDSEGEVIVDYRVSARGPLTIHC